MALLKNRDIVGNYRVQGLIKANNYVETYKVVDFDDNPFFLKVFVVNKLPGKLLNKATNKPNEIECCQQINHRNLIGYIESDQFVHESGICQYYVTNYCQGSILSDYVQKNGPLSEEHALKVFSGILNALQYLHEKTPALCHNDLDPSNVMISPILDDEAVLIDYGHLSVVSNGIPHFDTSDLNLFYHAKETMVGIFDEKGDIFSACAILYFMLTGQNPWYTDIPSVGDYKDRFKTLWQFRKSAPLQLDTLANISAKTKFIIQHGLETNAANRFKSVAEIIKLLQSPDTSTVDDSHTHNSTGTASQTRSNRSNPTDEMNSINVEIKRGGGMGFKDVAGMNELKNYLQQRVIHVIKDKELAEQYRITPPNGMLLYGPPGCGKTFIAEKFAEETEFNFMLVKASDIGSSLVHGSQEKIKKIFALAEKNSPIVLCFDEFDAIVPDRSARGAEYVASEVNEFLSQMNNCSKRGIFIVATTNRPDKIDPAVRRTGRIDKQVFVPLPDLEARREMFKLYLDRRPVADNLDYNAFAEATEGYIASDIAYIINDVAMTAAFSRQIITNELINDTIQQIRPSLSQDVIQQYDDMRQAQNLIQRRVVVAGL